MESETLNEQELRELNERIHSIPIVDTQNENSQSGKGPM